jgi:hypothetical protein
LRTSCVAASALSASPAGSQHPQLVIEAINRVVVDENVMREAIKGTVPTANLEPDVAKMVAPLVLD